MRDARRRATGLRDRLVPPTELAAAPSVPGVEVRGLTVLHGRTVALREVSLDLARGRVTALVNCGTSAARLPDGDVLVASGPLEDGMLPPDTAAWVRLG